MNKQPDDVMKDLNEKFNGNFNEWRSISEKNIDITFIGLRSVAAVGEILADRVTSMHHDICRKIYDEIFSDGTCAVYLAANAMDKPANIVLRRVLELGVAAIYLWDMPHKAFSWGLPSQDLSFTEMVNHINSKGYLSYVINENKYGSVLEILPSSRVQEIYGKLSDVVHGKITTFESSMPNRFVFDKDKWDNFIVLVNEVVRILVSAYVLRFNISAAILNKVPQASEGVI